MSTTRTGRNGIWILVTIAVVAAGAQSSSAAGIGSVLNNNYARWEWGSEYLPQGQTPVRLTVHIYSEDLDYIHPGITPYLEYPGAFAGREWLDSTLVEVNGQPVSGVESYYAMPPRDYHFTWEVTPKAGYAWPAESFYMLAGAYGTAGPDDPSGGAGAYPAVAAGYKFNSPSDYFSTNTNYSAGFADRAWGLSDSPTWTFSSMAQIIGRPRGTPEWNINPGMWVHEGDQIVFDSEPTNNITGDGTTGAEQWRILQDVPTAALIGGVLDKDGNWHLFASEGNPDGFIGGGKKVVTAPATGFVGRALNHAYYWESQDKYDSPYYPMPEYKLDVAIRAEPQSLGTYAVSGTDQLSWSEENESLSIVFDGVGAGDITLQKLRRDDPLLPDNTPAGTVWDILASDAFSFEDGSAVLTFEYDESLLPEGFNEEDILVWHWNGQEWEDVTGFLDMEANSVTTTELTSFSPFVVVPEPITLSMFGLGSCALLFRKRYRK